MEDYPRTLSEFEQWFSTEKACEDYLFQLRWTKGYRCARCGNEKAWSIGKGLYKCAKCKYKASVTVGTIFEGTHKPLTLWFRVIWWITTQKTGSSALGIQRILGLGSYETAWTWLQKLRRAMVRPGRDRLSGEIEVDEMYIGGKKEGKRGRGASGKALVVISAQLEGARISRIRLGRVQDASAPSLEQAVQQSVEPGSKVRTDGWRGYNGLGNMGYYHKIVRQDADIGENLLPHCHRVASLVKRWLIGTHQGGVSHEHLDYYLDEYTFRFNRRTSSHRGKLFYRLLQNAVATEPTQYFDIIKGVRRQKR